jgi:hypothetical protein
MEREVGAGDEAAGIEPGRVAPYTDERLEAIDVRH